MSANQGVTQLDGASEPAREAPRMNNRFRARCASALMHPATVTAVALLLLNDLVFKSVWPESWATGKLSDLAWVVFASPLLAFLLSFLVRRSTVGQRVAFIASYAALPLLYAAFNTFGPVHDLIIRGLSIASGGTSGSPLDVTDSLVIPFGLGIALWVWRRRIASAESLRMRLAVLTAGVAALASVATSESQPDFGMRDVGTSRDGAIHAGAWELGHFRSEDGGLSWRGGSVDSGQIEWGGESVDTPTGRYVIQGPDIVRFGSDGRSKLVFSTAYMQEEGNMWVQEHATSHLDARELTTAPRSIVYHEPSGNLIMAMGIQGVLVGTADGEWTRYAVGRYSPVDFSFLGKTGLLLSNGGFWAVCLALSLSMTGIALMVSRYRREDLPLLSAVAVATLSLLIVLPIVLGVTGLEEVLGQVLLIGLALSPLIVFALIGGAIVLGFMPRESRVRKSLGLGMGIPSLLASGGLLLIFGGSQDHPGGFYGEFNSDLEVTAVIAFTLGIAVVVMSWPQLRYWPPVIAAFLGMVLLVGLAFMLWLHLGVSLALTQASAVALVALAGLVLVGHARRKQ